MYALETTTKTKMHFQKSSTVQSWIDPVIATAILFPLPTESLFKVILGIYKA